MQKAVSITINSISDQSVTQTKEKFHTLVKLIKGESVQIGRDTLSTQGSPEAILFCQNLIAKKLVVSRLQCLGVVLSVSYVY